ncbi:MAG: thioredoxin [Alphaproteobacteria bacterium]|nr:MAG: thioredoxin [Alphaproteobacteria bacterium]
MTTTIGNADGKAPDGLIKSSDMSSFMADVIEESRAQPVLVDFWADWCEPCKTLTPLLEKVVNQAGGSVKLVKVNVDDNKDLAAQLHVESLPTVMAFKDGQPVDGFAGVLSESEIKTFIVKIGGNFGAPDNGEILQKAKELLEAGEVAPALELYAQIAQDEPENLDAIGGLARAYIKAGHLQQARELLETIAEDKKSHPGLVPAFAALDLAGEEGADSNLDALRAAANKNPDDNQAQYDLARALFATDKKEEAAEALLAIIARDREWDDNAARKLLIKMFAAAGAGDPFTIENRRKLSSILFS